MNRKNAVLKAAILAQLKDDRWTSCTELSGRLMIGYDRPLYYLNILMAEGKVERKAEVIRHIDSNASSRRYVYRLATEEQAEPEAPASIAGAPYRNLRLSENLVDYDRSLHKFEALCMETRK